MLVRAVLLAVMVGIAGGLAARRGRFLTRLVRLGRPEQRGGDLPRRLAREGTEVLGQRKLLQRARPGLMHALIFWGFLVLLTTIVEVGGQLIDPAFELPVVGGTRLFGLIQDLFAAGVLVGIAIAVAIRVAHRPERFVGSHARDAYRILGLIFWIVVTLFLARGVRIALGYAPESWWTPASTATSFVFGPIAEGWQRATMWILLLVHVALILGFLVYLGYSKHLHIATSALNVFFARTGPPGALAPLRIDLENDHAEDVYLGASTVEDLTWKQRLDLITCTECGRCQSACPAWNTAKPLSPKLLVMNLRDHLFERGSAAAQPSMSDGPTEPVPLVPEVVDDEVLWACTTCGACMQECPVDIEHVDTIVDMRRSLVMAESRFPTEVGTLLRNLETSGNPWGMPQAQRADWARGLDVHVIEEGAQAPEYLYWVGCAGAFDDRAMAISRAVVTLLQRARVPFAILGPRELCTGDPARRIGNEYLFQTLVEQNVQTLEGARVTKVIANCPHCFNTIRNEYPDYGARFDVIHHSQLLDHLVAEGRLVPTAAMPTTIAYHDPCYLGRHNGVYEQPRRTLREVPGLRTVEMPRHGQRALCCGAGGARMWIEERIGKRINEERVDEATSTGADALGVACPYCLIMLDDGQRARKEQLPILDLAQVLARSIIGDGD